jgi:hypothetical protein
MSKRGKPDSKKVHLLCKKLGTYIRGFNSKKHDRRFTGPSVYFHQETMKRRRQLSASRALSDKRFLELLYATLCSWGMHRMGRGPTKLVDFGAFKRSIAEIKPDVVVLQRTRIDATHLDPSIPKTLLSMIRKLKVGEARKKIVFGSKTLHHILPELVPPIDNEYTLRFFYGRPDVWRPDDRFCEVYDQFRAIATSKRSGVLRRWALRRRGLHTSITKEIDNAIVGYVRCVPGQKPKQRKP